MNEDRVIKLADTVQKLFDDNNVVVVKEGKLDFVVVDTESFIEMTDAVMYLVDEIRGETQLPFEKE